MSDPLASLFLERSRYFLGTEYLTKLRSAVEALPAEALWWRPNEQSNSVGNLLLHLNGNIRQWIVRGVGGAPGSRDRAAEFAAKAGPAAAVLMADLETALAEIDRILGSLTPADLVDHAGDVVTREELQQNCGPRTHLSISTIT